MTRKIHKVYLLGLLAFLSQVSLSSCEDIHSLWNEFWSVSCELSGVVSRSRRAIPEEPNLDDPNEFFKYLYPLADLKVEDLLKDEQRSSSPLEISTWLDDLIKVWQKQCHSGQRREKRDSYQQQQNYDYRDYGDRAGDDGGSDSAANDPGTNVTTTGSTEAPTKAVVSDSDTFFSQYGGDIEYFFPLIQFGIPFDGEITFLGFKGFKGLFPY